MDYDEDESDIEICSTQCCGVYEIHGIIGCKPKAIIKRIYNNHYDENSKCAFYTFTDIHSMGYGRALASYIRRNKLGKVMSSPVAVNPNTKHDLRIWVWTVDANALLKFYKKNC